MILRGILDRSLSSQLCIRGFAPIKQLARISKADYTYQRELLDRQQSEISTFLDEEEYLFFPEVILSFKIKYDLGKGKAGVLSPIQQLEVKGSFKSNVDKSELNTKTQKYQNTEDSRGSKEVKIVELVLDSEVLNEAITNNEHPFHRVDGNHRLSAAEKATSSRVEQMVVPFCIILSEVISDSSNTAFEESNEEKRSKKFEKVVFHNINTKTIPLKSEENLRVILDDDVNFPDEEIKEKFGDSYLLTRKLGKLIPLQSIEDIFGHLIEAFKTDSGQVYKNAVLYKMLYFLRHNKLIKSNAAVEKIKEAMKTVDSEFHPFNQLSESRNSAFFIAAVGIELHRELSLKPFIAWIAANHLGTLREVQAQSLYDIYLKTHDSNPKIFVAMPYEKEIVESRNADFQRVVNKINADHPNVRLELFPIMTHKGGTQDIVQAFIAQIDKCAIFIADVSESNPNVTYELGYARSKNIPCIILKKQNDDTKTPFDFEHDVQKKYNSEAIKTLEDIVEGDVKAILSEEGYID